MTPSHRDDFGDMTIDGNIVTHADNITTDSVSNNSSISLPTTLDDQAEAAERVRFICKQKWIYRYEASGSTTINNIRSTEIASKPACGLAYVKPASINGGAVFIIKYKSGSTKILLLQTYRSHSSDISGSTSGYFYNYSPSGSKRYLSQRLLMY